MAAQWIGELKKAKKTCMVAGGAPSPPPRTPARHSSPPPIPLRLARRLTVCDGLPGGAGLKKIHYTFGDGREMVEEWEMGSDLLACASRRVVPRPPR